MAPSEGKRLLCLGKQLNYVWSVSELDKKKKLRSKKIAGIRGWIQAAATLLTNPHIPNFFQGKIYQGKAKTVCVPGLNCYSCPAATGACPIGAFQAVVGSSKFKFSYYITGFLILLGVTLGRFICGFFVSVWMVSGFASQNPWKEILHGQTEAAAVSEIYHPCCFCDSSADVCNEFDRDGRSVLLQIYLSAGRSGGGDPAFHRKCRNPVCTGQAVFV